MHGRFLHLLSDCLMAYHSDMQSENNDRNPVTLFAVTNYRDIRKRFGIKEKNRRGHIYIIGKTGTGKSTLMENMVISDVKDGSGLALIDPHGDLAEDVLDSVSESRREDVIYFNPADLEYPIPLNPLESTHRDYHHLIASGLISVFKKIWPDFWGPRLEHILRHSILTLLEHPNATLLDIPRLLTDKEFRKGVIGRVTNQQVREFWLLEFEKYSAWLRSQAISPILNKVGQFLTSVPIRNIAGQKENTFHLRKAMDEGKILNPNLVDYKLLRSTEMPKTKVMEVETFEPEGPFGAKEAGEGLTNPTAGALGNAVFHAAGISIKNLPITPENVLEALKNKNTKRKKRTDHKILDELLKKGAGKKA